MSEINEDFGVLITDEEPQESKREILSKIYYDKLKQTTEDLVFAYNYKDKDGENKFSKWIEFVSAGSIEIEKATHRSIGNIEIVLDIDGDNIKESKKTFDKIIKKLNNEGYSYEAYFTGSKGYHIHLIFEELNDLRKNIRKKIKEQFISNFNVDKNLDFQKSSERCLIALENVSHWKSGKIKKLVCEKDFGKNKLPNFFEDKEAEANNLNNEFATLKDEVKTSLILKDQNNATELIVKYIEKIHYLYTTRNDEKQETWIYDNGIYIPHGKSFITEICRKVLDLAFTPQINNKVIAKIQADTHIDQNVFFSNNIIDEIPVLNGILNIKTRELTPYDPKKIFFSKINSNYNKDVDCPKIKEFIKSIVIDEEPILQEVAGYCLLKDYPIQKAFMFLGTGQNGKGRFLELLKNFLSIDNVCNIPLQTFEKDKYIASELFGKLANLGGDISKQKLNDTELFKSLTGQDIINTSRKFLTSLKFENYSKQIFNANDLPQTEDTSDGFMRRWCFVKFPFQFKTQIEINQTKKEDRKFLKLADTNIIKNILSQIELDGFLNYALDGLDRLLKNKSFSFSKTTEENKIFYLRRSSSLMAFFQDKCEKSRREYILKDEFKEKYSFYCEEHDLKLDDTKKISQMMETLNIWSKQKNVSIVNSKILEEQTNFQRKWVWMNIKFK